ncbi:MAG: YbhB/YbcL family Raf kinase inhibitor-like protein [Methanoregula sp.]
MKIIRILCPCLVVLLVLTCGCTAPVDTPPSSPPPAATSSIPAQGSSVPENFTLAVDSVTPGSGLPQEFTCTGSSRTPGISWENVPAGTQSYVLILDDPDAPAGTFTHWIVYNIPPDTQSIDPAQPDGKVLSGGAQIGLNSAGSRGYYPPCPPPGTSHRYIFRLYAVDMVVVQPTADRASIDRALTGHTLGEAQVRTTFKR